MVDKQDALLQAWTRMVNCIAHDVTTPVASIRLENNGLKKILPKLLDGYQLAAQHQLVDSSITPDHLEMVETFATGVENNLSRILSFLSVLCSYSQKLSAGTQDPVLSMSACIQDIIKNYPFSDEQRRRVHVACRDDFQFKIEPFFVEHLLLNLLDNALSHIDRMGKGEIHIWTAKEDCYFTLHFKDTAGTLTEDAFARIFNGFFVKRDDHIVPGLGFCRLKWLHMGGDIICGKVKDESVEFTVKFPVAT